jgi:hypothetical protein
MKDFTIGFLIGGIIVKNWDFIVANVVVFFAGIF